jgi:hypothetical protein
MSGLSDHERERIRSEERYRAEVRAELEVSMPRKQTNSVLTFLNSTFGIWLLSTVAVGLITWGYSVWHDERTNSERKSTEMRRIDLELMHRIRVMKTALLNLQSGQPVGYNLAFYIDKDQTFSDSAAPQIASVFPEYEKATTVSLLITLSGDVDHNEAKRLAPAISSWERMLQIRDEAFDKFSTTSLDKNLGGEGLIGIDAERQNIEASKVLQIACSVNSISISDWHAGG